MKKLLVAVLVLVVLALAVDRGGDLAAQHYVATELQDSQGLPETPDVDITGFPFLTQVAANRFDRIDVVATDLPTGGGGDALRVSRVEARFLGVSRSGGTVTAERVRADGVIGFDQIGDALGIDVEYAAGGSLRVGQTFEVGGQTVDPTITVAPRLVDGSLTFAEPVVEDLAAGQDGVFAQLGDVFGVSLPLRGLPFDVSVDDLRVERDGVHVELSGRDLSYG